MQTLVNSQDNTFKNIVVGTFMFFCVLVTLVALHLADQANSRANRLGLQVNTQQQMLDSQASTMTRILTLSGAHQNLIEGILDNQEGIVDIVSKRAKRQVASTKP